MFVRRWPVKPALRSDCGIRPWIALFVCIVGSVPCAWPQLPAGTPPPGPLPTIPGPAIPVPADPPVPGPSASAPTASPAPTSPAPAIPPEDQTRLGRWLVENTLREILPKEYENDKKWGTTKAVFDGWHIKADGLKISTKRKWKHVKHGTWKRYRLKMVDPEEYFEIALGPVQSIGPTSSRVDATIKSRVQMHGQLEEWQRGVRLIGVSSDAVADFELRLSIELTTWLDATKYPADLGFSPRVTAAELRMPSFKVTRVGQASGPIVRELGDAFEHLLDDLIAEKNAELPRKINEQLEKKKDKFRISASDLLTKSWLQWLKPSTSSPPAK